MLERFYLIKNVLITLRFLMLCASVGNKGGFSIVDARCNHEVCFSMSLAVYYASLHLSCYYHFCFVVLYVLFSIL